MPASNCCGVWKSSCASRLAFSFDRFDVQATENRWQEVGRVRVGVIDHQLKIARNAGKRIRTQRAKEHVGVDLIDMLNLVDAPNFVEIDPPVIFTEKDPFDLALGGGINIKTIGIRKT